MYCVACRGRRLGCVRHIHDSGALGACVSCQFCHKQVIVSLVFLSEFPTDYSEKVRHKYGRRSFPPEQFYHRKMQRS